MREPAYVLAGIGVMGLVSLPIIFYLPPPWGTHIPLVLGGLGAAAGLEYAERR